MFRLFATVDVDTGGQFTAVVVDNGGNSVKSCNRAIKAFLLVNAKLCWLKGTVSRDFLLLVYFMNQFPPSPRVSY